MNKWQKLWFFVVLVFSFIHIIRDIFQDFGIKNFLSTILASPGPPKVPSSVYWTIFNTYAIAVIEIVSASICLRRNYFGKLGNITLAIAIISMILWFFYYFYL